MNEINRYPRNPSLFARVALLSAAAALCLCGGKQPKQEQFITLWEQRKLEQQKNMPDLTITATEEDYCRVAFETKEDKGVALCVIGSDGKGLKKKQCGFIGSALHVSPNGKKVAFYGYSSRGEYVDEGGICQAVYDVEADTFGHFQLPYRLDKFVWWRDDNFPFIERVGDPRWWDDNHIYYRYPHSLVIVKQNIQTGEHTEITINSDLGNMTNCVWDDPVWMQGIRNYIVLRKKQICFHKNNWKMIRCDSLPYEPMFGSLKVLNYQGERCVSFTVNVDTIFDFRMGTYVQTLSGKRMFLKTKIGRCKNYENGVSLSFDPAGKWIYYEQTVIVDPYSRDNFYMLRRVSVSDSTLDQLIYFNTKGLGNITCISE